MKTRSVMSIRILKAICSDVINGVVDISSLQTFIKPLSKPRAKMAAKNSADCVALKISKRFNQESKHKSSDKDEGHTGSRHVASGNSSAVCSIRERHRHVCVMSC